MGNMVCPHCKKPIDSVAAKEVTALSTMYKGTIRAVAYLCPECKTVLTVESHPLEREEQTKQIKDAIAKVQSDLAAVTNRVKGISLNQSAQVQASKTN